MNSSNKVLLIYRDGPLIETKNICNSYKFSFYPKVISNIANIATDLDYDLVMVTINGNCSLNNSVFHHIINTFNTEGVKFSVLNLNRNFPEEQSITIKKKFKYLKTKYFISSSFVIGYRISDVSLAKFLGCKAILLNKCIVPTTRNYYYESLQDLIALETNDWKKIYCFLKLGYRNAKYHRVSRETDIHITLNLDGNGKANICTGIGFFDHMLDQLAYHSEIDIQIKAKGDLYIDDHHTLEDIGICFGEAFIKALGNPIGIERYGFCLPMDDCISQVTLDLGGRSYFVWKVKFIREKIGKVSTEMFEHFFKSFSDSARCNLHILAKGNNDHHKIEAIFKAFARAVKMSIKRNKIFNNKLPTTKGRILNVVL